MKMLQTVKKVIETEKEALNQLLESLDERYNQILEVLYYRKGKVIFMGVGKSGLIGKKLAATFSSTGTPSFFVHATEAVHGDLGMIEAHDIVILISNSGKTSEVLEPVNQLKMIGCTTIAFTAEATSPLAQSCDYQIIYPFLQEADHLGLAPTVSSTLTLVLGDAIACALSKQINFERSDFYRNHPSGTLGQKLKKSL